MKVDYDEIRRRRDAGDCEGLPSLLLPLARSGDPEAQYLLGSLMSCASCLDWKAFLPWLQAAARQQHPGALFELSRVHELEHGDLGTSPADSPERQAMLRKAAELGWRDAQRELGCLLCWGEDGWPKDPAEGRVWYGRAAEQGHVEAQYDLGMMLLDGEGGEVDTAAGFAWLREAADGDDLCQSGYASKVLADLLEHGWMGVQQDIELSRHYRAREEEFERRYQEKRAGWDLHVEDDSAEDAPG